MSLEHRATFSKWSIEMDKEISESKVGGHEAVAVFYFLNRQLIKFKNDAQVNHKLDGQGWTQDTSTRRRSNYSYGYKTMTRCPCFQRVLDECRMWVWAGVFAGLTMRTKVPRISPKHSLANVFFTTSALFTLYIFPLLCISNDPQGSIASSHKTLLLVLYSTVRSLQKWSPTPPGCLDWSWKSWLCLSFSVLLHF